MQRSRVRIPFKPEHFSGFWFHNYVSYVYNCSNDQSCLLIVHCMGIPLMLFFSGVPYHKYYQATLHCAARCYCNIIIYCSFSAYVDFPFKGIEQYLYIFFVYKVLCVKLLINSCVSGWSREQLSTNGPKRALFNSEPHFFGTHHWWGLSNGPF